MDQNLYKKTFAQLNVSEHVVDDVIHKTLSKGYAARRAKAKKVRLRWAIAIAIVSITCSMTIVADSKGMFAWATHFFNFGEEKTDEDQRNMIDDVGISLGISDESKGSMLEVKSMIGDNTRCLIYFELTAPENKVLNAFDRCHFREMKIELDNEKMQKNTQYSIQHSIRNVKRLQKSKLSFVMEMVTLGEVNLTDSTVKLSFKDFGESKLDVNAGENFYTQVEGEWHLEFPINYNSKKISVTDRVNGEIEGNNATIAEVTLSPISLSVDYVLPYHEDAVSKYWPILYNYQGSYLLTDENEKLYIIDDCWITRKSDNRLSTNYYCKVLYLFNRPIDISTIKSIVIYGNEIIIK